MTPESRFTAMQSEQSYLRAELELNRKYMFERPLIILAGAFTAAATFKDLLGYIGMPSLFIVLLAFNMWFTYNRAISNARIIAYLQYLHTPSNYERWIGWEAALRQHRVAEPSLRKRWTKKQLDHSANRFYTPLFVFHIVCVLSITSLLALQWLLAQKGNLALRPPEMFAFALDSIALVAFAVLCISFRPTRIDAAIAFHYRVWEYIFTPEANDG